MKSYYIAVNLLVTMNELLNISNMGELTDGLLAYYYKKYSRYSAFKKEIIAFRDKCDNDIICNAGRHAKRHAKEQLCDKEQF